MKLMVIGGGGREHAIIKKLKEIPAVEVIYCLPGNGGIAADAVCVSEIGAKDISAQVEFARAHGIDYAVVAPDDPLALGAVDALSAAGIPCFGPDKKAAVIEASKAFSKDLMKKYGIPTAKYELFTEAEAACAYIEAQGAPIVVKADGLALGKGVVVAATVEEAKLLWLLEDETLSEIPVELDEGETEGSFVGSAQDVTLSLPDLDDGGTLRLLFSVRLSDGRTLTAEAASWTETDGELEDAVG